MAATQSKTAPPKQAPKAKGGDAKPAGGDGSKNGRSVPAPRLKERYVSEIAPGLREEFSYANVMQIPTLTKIVVNMGVGEAARDAKLIEGAVKDLSTITGQKPAVAKAKRSVAQF